MTRPLTSASQADLAVIVVFDDVAALGRARPAQELIAAADWRDAARREVVRRADVQDRDALFLEFLRADALLVHRYGHAAHGVLAVDLANLIEAGILDAETLVAA